MGGLGPFRTDCESILSHLKRQDKQLLLKRRWLMGLPFTKSEEKKFEGPDFTKKKNLPESLLREDDIYYDTVKAHVEEAFGVHRAENVPCTSSKSMELLDISYTMSQLVSNLDVLTNKGLYNLALIVTDGSVKLVKTRSRMKKIIKESLLKLIRQIKKSHSHRLEENLSRYLSNPCNFRGSYTKFVAPAAQIQKAAATSILSRLENFPTKVLMAMWRNLQGVQGKLPRLHVSKCGRKREYVITRVRKRSMKMLSELGSRDLLQEPLAKAMAIADLSLMLELGYKDPSTTEFYRCPAEIKILQNEIVKAIWLLKATVSFPELKILQTLIDPDDKTSNRSLRCAFTEMLTEYLFLCFDLNPIPKTLREVLAIINRTSQAMPHACFPQEMVEEDVECILDLSAQMKQSVLNVLAESGYDEDFACAYEEELEESEDASEDEDGIDGGKNSREWSCHIDPNLHVEGYGETSEVGSNQFSPVNIGNNHSPFITPSRVLKDGSEVKVEPDISLGCDSSTHFTASSVFWELRQAENVVTNQAEHGSDFYVSRRNGGDFSPYFSTPVCLDEYSFDRMEAVSDDVKLQEKCYPVKQRSSSNLYLGIQEVCDETSTLAYDLIGYMLGELALLVGLDIDVTDSSYLKADDLTKDDKKVAGLKPTGTLQDPKGFAMMRAVEKLIPSPEIQKRCQVSSQYAGWILWMCSHQPCAGIQFSLECQCLMESLIYRKPAFAATILFVWREGYNIETNLSP